MLCGEKVYTRPAAGAAVVEDRSGAPRQALHSAEVRFVHPVTGKSMRFASPLAARHGNLGGAAAREKR